VRVNRGGDTRWYIAVPPRASPVLSVERTAAQEVIGRGRKPTPRVSGCNPLRAGSSGGLASGRWRARGVRGRSYVTLTRMIERVLSAGERGGGPATRVLLEARTATVGRWRLGGAGRGWSTNDSAGAFLHDATDPAELERSGATLQSRLPIYEVQGAGTTTKPLTLTFPGRREAARRIEPAAVEVTSGNAVVPSSPTTRRRAR